MDYRCECLWVSPSPVCLFHRATRFRPARGTERGAAPVPSVLVGSRSEWKTLSSRENNKQNRGGNDQLRLGSNLTLHPNLFLHFLVLKRPTFDSPKSPPRDLAHPSPFRLCLCSAVLRTCARRPERAGPDKRSDGARRRQLRVRRRSAAGWPEKRLLSRQRHLEPADARV